MKIGIDISQCIYEGTGVAEYVTKLVGKLLEVDGENEYVLFFSNTKKFEHFNIRFQNQSIKQNSNLQIRSFRIPIYILELLWNRMHIVPIEWFIGNIDVFYTSDWVEPPVLRAKKITTIHDLSVLKVPETFDESIVRVHKRKLDWVKKESDMILCDSAATRDDAAQVLGIEHTRLRVVYPGV